MKILILAIAFSLIGTILGAESCKLSQTRGGNIKSFSDCKSYSTSSESKVCCYINGKDKNENSISACNELTGTVNGALADLYSLEDVSLAQYRDYYLNADCNLGETISLCEPDDRKSESPLSAQECAKYSYVGIMGVDKSVKCCYVTGTNVSKKNVYSCTFIDSYFTKSKMKGKIESGEYRRLGALTDVNIECYSGKFYPLLIMSLIFALLNFL